MNGTSFKTGEISGQIDELRVHPKDAQMTTFTWDPLNRLTSQTDPNGLVTYYRYNNFGQLLQILDHDKNILQEYDYNYAH